MKKISFFICLLIISALSRTAMADITVAVIAPKAGVYEKAGSELFKGARLAMQELNDSGGINGEKIDMLTIDDRCDSRLAISTAEMLSLLKSKKIGLVIGPYCSNQFDEIAAIYEKSKIFQIVPTTEAYHSGSTDKKGQIVMLGTKEQMSRDFFSFYNTHFAGLKVGFVYDTHKEADYADTAKALYNEFQRYGKGTFLKFYVLHKDEIDEIEKSIVDDKIEVVFLLGREKYVTSLIYDLRRENKDMIIFTAKNMISDEELKDMGEMVNGLYLMELQSLKNSLMFTESLVNLRLLGIEPEGLESYGYVALKLWGDLAKTVNSFDYHKLYKAANSQSLKEKWGDFLMHSGSIGAAKYIIEMYQDGSLKQVY